MDKPELPLVMCPLCAKQISEVLLPFQVANTKWGNVSLSICSKCRIILHNINRIMNDFVNRMVEQDKKNMVSHIIGLDGKPVGITISNGERNEVSQPQEATIKAI